MNIGGIIGGRFLTGQDYQAAKARAYHERARSPLGGPMIISDYVAGAGSAVKSMVDGKMYDSKSALRASYLPSGNPRGERYIEVGNEEQKPPPRAKPDRKSIRAAVGKAMNRVGVSVDG